MNEQIMEIQLKYKYHNIGLKYSISYFPPLLADGVFSS